MGEAGAGAGSAAAVESVAEPGDVRVTGLKPAGRERLSVCLSDGTRVVLSALACHAFALAPGRPADPRLLQRRAMEEAAEAAALRLLAVRARSAADLRHRLARRFPPEAVARALDRVAPYLDEAVFARDRVVQILARRPVAPTLLAAMLRNEGVEAAAAAAAVAAVDEGLECARALAQVARRLRGAGPADAERRLAMSLARRGFSASAIRRALATWRERGVEGV